MVPAGGARDARLSPSAPSPVTPRPSREASCGMEMGSGGGRQSRGGRGRRRVPARRRARVREANPTSCEVRCQSAGWRDKKKRARGVGRRRRAGARDRRTRIRAAREARGVSPRAFRAIPPRRAARDDRDPRPAGVSIARHFAVTLAEVPSRAQPRTSQSIVERRLLASSTRVSHLRQRRDRQARSRSTYARNVPRHSRRAPSMRPVTRGTGVPSTRTNASEKKTSRRGDIGVVTVVQRHTGMTHIPVARQVTQFADLIFFEIGPSPTLVSRFKTLKVAPDSGLFIQREIVPELRRTSAPSNPTNPRSNAPVENANSR
jgi:hypothetical protein